MPTRSRCRKVHSVDYSNPSITLKDRGHPSSPNTTILNRWRVIGCLYSLRTYPKYLLTGTAVHHRQHKYIIEQIATTFK